MTRPASPKFKPPRHGFRGIIKIARSQAQPWLCILQLSAGMDGFDRPRFISCSFSSAREAAQAYDELAQHYFGAAAITNYQLGLLPDPPVGGEALARLLRRQHPRKVKGSAPPLTPRPTPRGRPGKPVQIALTSRGEVRGYALVDPLDQALVEQYAWRCDLHKGRARTRLNGKASRCRELGFYSIPQLITGARHVQHRNGDALDCRRSNLRVVTNLQQHLGPRGNLPRGVVRTSAGQSPLYRAEITIKGQRYVLGGLFSDPLEAALTYDRAALHVVGPGALLNHPERRAQTRSRPLPEFVLRGTLLKQGQAGA